MLFLYSFPVPMTWNCYSASRFVGSFNWVSLCTQSPLLEIYCTFWLLPLFFSDWFPHGKTQLWIGTTPSFHVQDTSQVTNTHILKIPNCQGITPSPVFSMLIMNKFDWLLVPVFCLFVIFPLALLSLPFETISSLYMASEGTVYLYPQWGKMCLLCPSKFHSKQA